MNHRSVVVALCVTLLWGMLTEIPVGAQEPEGCAGGENSEQGPPPPPDSHPVAACEAAPASSEPGPAQPEDQGATEDPGSVGTQAVTPTTRFWLGIEENGDFPIQGVGGTLNVVNPQVVRGTNNFLTQRVRVAACSTGQFLEFGWAEVGWRDDRQYLYSFDSINNQWRWYDQYFISSGSPVLFDMRHWGNGNWAADLWWNGQWQRLGQVNLGNHWGCITTPMVEISTDGTSRQFPFPSIKYGNGTQDYFSLGLIEAMSGNFRIWDTSIPTQENVTSEAGYYTTSFQTRYTNFTVNSNNRAPTPSVSVSPTSGDRSTTFNATVGGSDPDGDTISNHRIDWGDGTSTFASSGTHKYQSAGSFQVRGHVCDMWGVCALSSPVTVSVAFSNTAPTLTFAVSPTQGTVSTTEFQASFFASDPEGDPLSYFVDWDDGTESPSPTARHIYAAAGDYVVTGTAIDSFGAITSRSVTVRVCSAIVDGECIQQQDDPCAADCNPDPAPEPESEVQPPPSAEELLLAANDNCDNFGGGIEGAYHDNPNTFDYGARADINIRFAHICGSASNSISTAWAMLAQSVQPPQGGWAQIGYIYTTGQNLPRIVSQDTKPGCFAGCPTKFGRTLHVYTKKHFRVRRSFGDGRIRMIFCKPDNGGDCRRFDTTTWDPLGGENAWSNIAAFFAGETNYNDNAVPGDEQYRTNFSHVAEFSREHDWFNGALVHRDAPNEADYKYDFVANNHFKIWTER